MKSCAEKCSAQSSVSMQTEMLELVPGWGRRLANKANGRDSGLHDENLGISEVIA